MNRKKHLSVMIAMAKLLPVFSAHNEYCLPLPYSLRKLSLTAPATGLFVPEFLLFVAATLHFSL